MPFDDSSAKGALEGQFDSVETALAALRAGQLIIVADDADRENEGDLVGIAELMSPEQINFMAQEARGLICLTLEPDWCDRLELTPMVAQNTEAMQTAFTISIDAHPKFGVTTGISAADRATTIQVAVASDAVANDLRRPGHIFPLKARPGGVLERVGHTEASVDLARLTGCKPAGVICEILNTDGTMARRPELFAFAKTHNLPFITVAQLIAYRMQTERLVEREAETILPTLFGDFKIIAYHNKLDDGEHLAIIKGDIEDWDQTPEKAPLVRVHSECLTGDLLGSLRCDCGFQLHGALKQISDYGKGVVVYLRKHEGRGIGLVNKLKAYQLQDKGLDTVEANLALGFAPDLRQYGVGAQILRDLGIESFHLLTNNPRKLRGLEGYGLRLLERVPLQLPATAENAYYLATKRTKLGHLLEPEG